MIDVDKRRIEELAGKYKKEIVEFIQELVRTPSVNGVDSEKSVVELIARKAEELNLPYRLLAKDKERPNIFVGRQFANKQGLLFIAHLDTVPAGDTSKWTHPPFAGKIKGGKLYGRGTIDCKAGAALSIYALKILADLGIDDAAKFVGVVDEESGADSKIGAQYLLDKGLSAEAAIYTFHGVNTVTIGHRGLVRLWIEVYGETAHTGQQHWQYETKGANAIKALLRFINQLSKIKMEGKHSAFPGYGFKQTVTLIEGGVGESIVPDKAKSLVDARLLPNHDNREYMQAVKDIAGRFTSEKIHVDVTVKTNIPGAVISRKEKIAKILAKLDKEIMEVTPEVRGTGPANEGYMFIKAGIPTICGFGAEGDNVHAVDEHLKLNTLPKILQIYSRAALELCG